ncbi:hypothetical protein [Luteococcus peritonei]|uniref:Biopolymer transporter Tol n=1 Tax=Luteococcus peritonei TaxID=88874 RepID=A0ABW4RYF0_9ACTN
MSPTAGPSGRPGPERTPDGRHIVVGGRRWRATDPVLDEAVTGRLRAHLGRARSMIGRLHSEEERQPWRRRVQLAKQGLGERGTAWWELDEPARRQRAERMLDLLEDDASERG